MRTIQKYCFCDFTYVAVRRYINKTPINLAFSCTFSVIILFNIFCVQLHIKQVIHYKQLSIYWNI